jgi:ABC-2 type transport system permease protein
MEQLAATPVEAVEVVLGKLVPYLGIGLFDVTMTVVLGLIAFHVPFRGNPWLLLAASLLFLIGGLGLGIAISAKARSQVMATQISMLATYLPGFLLSGFAFDIDGMPLVLKGLSYAVSARYFIVVTRGIFLKGVGLGILWPQFVALTLFAVVGLGLAIGAFRKEIEP